MRSSGFLGNGLPRFLSLRATPRDFEVASRAAIAIAVPLFLLLALDRLDLAAYASFGAMTALYGRSEPYRVRLRSLSIAAVALVLSVGLGATTAAMQVPLAIEAAGLVVVVTLGLLLTAVFGLFPPTPLFFVFAYVVCAALPTAPVDIARGIAIAAASAAFALLVSMSGWVLRRAGGQRGAEFFKPLPRLPRITTQALRDPAVWLAVAQNVVGVLLVGALATALGIGHPYWAVVSVVAVIPPPRARHSISRAIHRVTGTAVGVLLAGALLIGEPPAVVILIAVVIAQFAAELLISRHYGATLVFVTPLALGVAQLAAPMPLPALLADRLVETALGAVIGLALVLLARWLEPRMPVRRDGDAAPPAS